MRLSSSFSTFVSAPGSALVALQGVCAATRRSLGVGRLAQGLAQGLMVACTALAAPVALAAGDAEAGAKLTTACQACHGTDGNGLAPNYPNIAGQNERYLFRQLQMIQSEARSAPLMAGQLNGMSETDLRNIAAFYAEKEPKLSQAQGDDEQIALAQTLYRGGSMEKGVAACTACHSPSGSGNAPAGFPRISGQSPEYTIEQLTNYREGRRETDEEYGAMMRQVAANLNDTEIAALADYLQGLH